MKLLSWAIAAVLVPLGSGAGIRDAMATHNQYLHCAFVPNWYGQQWTDKGYVGMFGWFFTFQPFVPDLNTQFSLSHLYVFAEGPSFPSVEVGVFRGLGQQRIQTNSGYYSAVEDSVTAYTEHDYEDAASGVYVVYEVQFEGFDFGVMKYMWGVYANDLTTARDVWRIKDLPNGHAVSGGEVTRSTGIEMAVSLIPNHQLKTSDSIWHDWNPTFMSQQADNTNICNNLGFGYVSGRQFDSYSVGGTGP